MLLQMAMVLFYAKLRNSVISKFYINILIITLDSSMQSSFERSTYLAGSTFPVYLSEPYQLKVGQYKTNILRSYGLSAFAVIENTMRRDLCVFVNTVIRSLRLMVCRPIMLLAHYYLNYTMDPMS